jgi:uncharacterized membrane protein
MTGSSNQWSSKHTESVIGAILRLGVLLAASVVAFGGIIFLARHGTSTPDYGVFQGEPAELATISGILSYALSFHGRGIIQLGLLFLIATPVARVAFSVFAFALERDWLYVAVTIAVLAVLVFSLAGGQL